MTKGLPMENRLNARLDREWGQIQDRFDRLESRIERLESRRNSNHYNPMSPKDKGLWAGGVVALVAAVQVITELFQATFY